MIVSLIFSLLIYETKLHFCEVLECSQNYSEKKWTTFIQINVNIIVLLWYSLDLIQYSVIIICSTIQMA